MKKLIYLSLFLSVQLYALSPRILIKFSPENPISLQELATAIDAHVVSGDTEKELKEKIDALDKSSETHRIILDGYVKDIEKFAWRVGYELLKLQETTIDTASEIITQAEKEIPLTDESLPRVDAQTAGLMYDLMMKADQVFKEHNITYWATCGTLLGAVRHSGIIPWDDDIDICMYMHDIPKLLALKDALREYGLTITIVPYGFYKIHFIDGKKIEIVDKFRKLYHYKDYHEWTFPFIDIFPVYLDKNNRVHHSHPRLQTVWSTEYFLPYELIPPFTFLPFGPMHIPAPRNSQNIIVRMYGEDWDKITYCMYNHQQEDFMKKVKVALTDRSSVPYIMPVSN